MHLCILMQALVSKTRAFFLAGNGHIHLNSYLVFAFHNALALDCDMRKADFSKCYHRIPSSILIFIKQSVIMPPYNGEMITDWFYLD